MGELTLAALPSHRKTNNIVRWVGNHLCLLVGYARIRSVWVQVSAEQCLQFPQFHSSPHLQRAKWSCPLRRPGGGQLRFHNLTNALCLSRKCLSRPVSCEQSHRVLHACTAKGLCLSSVNNSIGHGWYIRHVSMVVVRNAHKCNPCMFVCV